MEENRNIWQEVLESTTEIKAGKGKRFVVSSENPVVQARIKTMLSQSEFAGLLGVSKRTLEQWEQGRREPSGAAKTLLRVAQNYPNVLRDMVR
jgi:putative transcriptional regulator